MSYKGRHRHCRRKISLYGTIRCALARQHIGRHDAPVMRMAGCALCN